jgi:HK97 gp10 family phage protein
MADGVEVRLIGLEELLGKLKDLPASTKLKGARFAMRKSANLVRGAVEQNALRIDDPATAQSIARNVTVRFSNRTFKQSGDVLFRVGIMGGARSTSRDALKSAARRRRRGIASLGELGEIEGKGSGNPGGDTFYWRFVEFGTQNAPARPFMRPALANNTQAATDVFLREYGRWLDRWARQQAKRGGG